MPTIAQISSPEYQAELRRQAEQQLAASRDLALNQIALGEQGIGQQEVTANRTADTLAEQLRRTAELSNIENQKQARVSGLGLQERFNQLGLLQSGLTAAGLGDIQLNLNKALTETNYGLNKGLQQSEQDRAASLANLALQRAGLGLKRTEVQQGYLKDVSDYVNNLIQQQYAAEQARLQAEEAARAKASAAGQGTAVNALLNALLGGGGKTTPATPNVPSVGGMAIDDIKRNIQGDKVVATFLKNGSTVTEPVTREQLADILSGIGYNNTSSRNTSIWSTIMGQIYQIVPDVKNTPNTGHYTSPTQYFGMGKTNKRRGF